MATHYLPLDAPVPASCRGGAVTIGNFDGVHLGHRALTAETQRQARALAGPAVAVTFDPHPLQLLRPEAFQPVLTTLAHRADLLEQAGVDHVLALETTPALLQLSAREFFERIIRGGLEAQRVVEGFNFFFGKGRLGNLDTLRQFCGEANCGLTVVPPVELDGRPVSSSRVRDELLAGNVTGATRFLGQAFRLEGLVGAGQRRGRTLGFPTANLGAIETIIPGNGVYAVWALLDGKSWPAAANVGPNPTFGEQQRKIEVHLLGFEGDLYGRRLAIDFVARLRDTRPFAGAADLIQQLRIDVGEAKRLLS